MAATHVTGVPLRAAQAPALPHCPLTLQNIIFAEEQQRFKLIDLGACADLRTGTNYVPDESILDPNYCPPEQARTHPSIQGRLLQASTLKTMCRLPTCVQSSLCSKSLLPLLYLWPCRKQCLTMCVALCCSTACPLTPLILQRRACSNSSCRPFCGSDSSQTALTATQRVSWHSMPPALHQAEAHI